MKLQMKLEVHGILFLTKVARCTMVSPVLSVIAQEQCSGLTLGVETNGETGPAWFTGGEHLQSACSLHYCTLFSINHNT